MIRTVIFDVMGVLFEVMGVLFEVGDDTRDLLVPYVRGLDPSLDATRIEKAYLEASLGKIDAHGFWQELGFRRDIERIQSDYLDNALSFDREFLDIADSLGSTFELTLLSNDVASWSRHLRRKHGLDHFFRDPVISGDVGLRKPDPAIYRLLLDRLGTDPAQCAFIDDRDKNLQAAAAFGMKTVRFDREPQEHTFAPDHAISRFRELPAILCSLA